jgi:hypothetical protein
VTTAIEWRAAQKDEVSAGRACLKALILQWSVEGAGAAPNSEERRMRLTHISSSLSGSGASLQGTRLAAPYPPRGDSGHVATDATRILMDTMLVSRVTEAAGNSSINLVGERATLVGTKRSLKSWRLAGRSCSERGPPARLPADGRG